MNFTNPTKYSATIPFIDVLMLYNGTAVAHIIAHDLFVHPGNNTNESIEVHWSPSALSGTDGVEAGRALLSSYISGEFPKQLQKVSYANSLCRYQHKRHYQNQCGNSSGSTRIGKSTIHLQYQRTTSSAFLARSPRRRQRRNATTFHPRRHGRPVHTEPDLWWQLATDQFRTLAPSPLLNSRIHSLLTTDANNHHRDIN